MEIPKVPSQLTHGYETRDLCSFRWTAKCALWNAGHLWYQEKCRLKHCPVYSVVIYLYANITIHYDGSLQLLEIFKTIYFNVTMIFLGDKTFLIHEINNNFNNKRKMCLITESHISVQGTNTYSALETFNVDLYVSIYRLYPLLE